MDKTTRDTLRKMVTQCRRLLEDATSEILQGHYGIHLKTGKIDEESRLGAMDEHDRDTRTRLLAHVEHIRAHGVSATSSVEQLVREISFTHLNRICAYKMMEKRGLIRETVSRGMQSTGVSWFMADHPDEEHLWNLGHQADVYRHFLEWTGHERAKDVAALFDPEDPANGVFPSQGVIDEVLALVNAPELEDIWGEDETIGWVYQYFTPQELRDKAHKESAAPRNSYELAFRNQFFTPRYVVEFLVDNTLGITWYEMNQGRTRLAKSCKYLVRRYDEVFLADQAAWARPGHLSADAEFLLDKANGLAPFTVGDQHRLIEFARAVRVKTQSMKPVREIERSVGQWNQGGPEDPVEGTTQDLWELLAVLVTPERAAEGKVAPMMIALTRIANEIRRRLLQARRKDLSTAEALKAPDLIPFRAWKDPRDLRLADIASGSGHFLLYCFDVLETIYREAYEDQEHGDALRKEYATRADLDRAIPGLILGNNLHGVDIDLRACQIASLALWLRAQRSYDEAGIRPADRPAITKANIIWVAPMPGEKELLDGFLGTMESEDLRRLVKEVFEGMQQAGTVGSLLAMEDDIKAAIKRVVGVRGGLFAKEDHDKWQLMHTELMKALTEYCGVVDKGENFKRTLFANDTAQGLSYIDLCETKMDVMLMNPPFGRPASGTIGYIDDHYHEWSGNILCAFLERGLARTESAGFVGCVVDRSIAMKSSYTGFRRGILLADENMRTGVDLGWQVLDANVEVAAWVVGCHGSSGPHAFFDVRSLVPHTKHTALVEAVEAATQPSECPYLCLSSTHQMLALPNSVVAFSFPGYAASIVESCPSLTEAGFKSSCGHTFTADRYGRLRWERLESEPVSFNSSRWAALFNGGSYCIAYSPERDIVLYGHDGSSFEHEPSLFLRNLQLQGRAGVGYGKRGDFLDPRLVPAGHVFTVEGQMCILEDEEEAAYLTGLFASSFFQYVLNLYCGQHKVPGYVGLFPYRTPPSEVRSAVADDMASVRSELSRWQGGDETDVAFVGPRLAWDLGVPSAHARSEAVIQEAAQATARIRAKLRDADDLISRLYHLDAHADAEIASYCQDRPHASVWMAQEETAGSLDIEVAESTRLVSYCVGAVLGRWDLRVMLGQGAQTPVHASCTNGSGNPSGMLQGEDGLPLSATPTGYPLRINWNGILVDEPHHTDDIIGRVREVLHLLWPDTSDSIEAEMCAALGVKDLRDYFRKPGSGGFWMDHVHMYSKSHRKAPIYWLLQSSHKNYSIWLYYQRLDSDLLFKVLQNYVEPKLKLEQNHETEASHRLTAGGLSVSETRQAQKDLEKQQDLVAEIRDFRDTLKKAADLRLTPDLDDGVVLNIAPLHDLVPWSEAAKYWDELLAGKYPWSSMGRQLEQKGMV